MAIPQHVLDDIAGAWPTQDYDQPIHFGDHEVYINFNSDTAGLLFHNWWAGPGMDKFREWVEECGEDYL